MINKIFSAFAAATLLLTACNNSTGSGNTVSAKPADFTIPTSVGSQTQPQGQFAADTNKQPGVITQPVAPVAVINTTSKAGLNPEHGQPGHRCDIAVGAPLDSKPTTPTVVPTQTNATPVMITPQPSLDVKKTVVSAPTVTSPTKAGLNPEHGQPGHRCDIAVGAPLDSKPTTPTVISTPGTTPAATTPTVSSIPPATPVVTPALPVKTDGATVTAPGMNPEHGKPGHRCDIAVGAPLDSKPTIVTEKKN